MFGWRRKRRPPWAAKSGPGYEFDDDGDLVWFASASATGYGTKEALEVRDADEQEAPKRPDPGQS